MNNFFFWHFFKVSIRPQPGPIRIFYTVTCTLMALSHCHKPVLWSKWPLASSLLQAIKTCRQACPPGYLMHFSKGWIRESLVNNNSKLTKLLKVWWKHLLFILFRRSIFQQMLNNFVNFELLFTKLSGIHSYEKCIK